MNFNLWTIAPENPFLDVLAEAVLKGFPLTGEAGTRPPLARWTLLVPTRRAARMLQDKLFAKAGKRGLLMPMIKPIGDIDEDLIEDGLPQEGVPDAISKAGQLNLIASLVADWAAANAGLPLAQDVLHSGAQAFHLALSLQEFLNQVETEETGFADLANAYDLDLAGHRAAILGLLELLSHDLPEKLSAAGLMGPAARRNLMIRLEAQRIAGGHHKGPIIAAGSTGTNPATRDLLKAIALHPMGAVVLPGFDVQLDDEAWNAISESHPQYAMKTMLRQWAIERQAVKELGAPGGRRQWLMRLALRPAEAAEGWREEIGKLPFPSATLLQNVELMEAADTQREAQAIALRLLKHVQSSDGKAAVITPDRDLARRVKLALRQWNVEIDDSGGEPLAHQGTGLLLTLLISTIADGFTPASLLALLHHPDCTLGLGRARCLEATRNLEIACLRGHPAPEGLAPLAGVVEATRQQLEHDPHPHPLAAAITPDEWRDVALLAERLIAVLHPFESDEAASLEEHIRHLELALAAIAPDVPPDDPVQRRLAEFLEGLKADAHWHPPGTFARAHHGLLHHLQSETVRPSLPTHDPQLSIFGLLEARLVAPELAILAGLSEGVWPQAPQTGPWVNRRMRETMHLQRPEREIGVTAHDFAQGFGTPQVVLSWPRRAGGEPSIPSRWILRLRAVLDALGVKKEEQLSTGITDIAARLGTAAEFKPWRRPEARPPVDARPKSFSVTEVEKLVRDSYSIHARRILKLEPLPPLSADLNAALRGTLIHAALSNWTQSARATGVLSLEALLKEGEAVFKPFMHMPEVARFWWMRFKRMAAELVPLEQQLHASMIGSHSEIGGRMIFPVAGLEHKLRARADRIDILPDGTLRLIDYKSGAVPTPKQVQSGFSPQLTLEAAMTARGAFKGLEPAKASAALYVSVGGNAQGVDVTWLEFNVVEVAEAHFESLVALLTRFLDRETAYIPRHHLFKADERSDFDHLSRRPEWELAGGGDT